MHVKCEETVRSLIKHKTQSQSNPGPVESITGTVEQIHNDIFYFDPLFSVSMSGTAAHWDRMLKHSTAPRATH